jgi:rSAM/selenodomain-associated transferase 2
MTPFISIILPVLHEEMVIQETLSCLLHPDVLTMAEIIVVDGDPRGSTAALVRDRRVQTVTGPAGRGAQMNEGARLSRGDILLFLHADTRLPEGAICEIRRAWYETGFTAGAFELGIDAEGPGFRLIEKMVSLRTRLTRIPYGDQAIFIRRAIFNHLGGYRKIPIMEDIDLMRRAKNEGGGLVIVKRKVRTSARRWRKEGLVACTLRNWTLSTAFYMGARPELLARFYR